MFPIIFFEVLLFILAAYKCIKHIRRMINLESLGHSSIIRVVFRDSLAYFFVCVVFSVASPQD